MKWPMLFVIAVLVLATIACSYSGELVPYTEHGGRPREVRWAMIEGELTSHALQRWQDAFPMCRIIKYALMVGGPTECVVIWYTCDVDR